MGYKVGDKISQFSLKDTNGDFFNSASLIGKKPVVIFFYPKDDTPGCTIQACSFRDLYQDFTDLGAEVIGISSDSEKSHQKFTKKYNLPYILLADVDKEVRKAFGVSSNLFGLLPGRATYVIDKEGVVQMVFNSMAAKEHMSKALKTVRLLRTK
jgi:thioredoxin-dependent peroxiredoxin